MILTTEAIQAIKGNSGVMNLIAAENNVTEWSVRRWIDDNEDNGSLTNYASLKIIRERTGLTDEQILTEASKQAS